MSARFLVLVKKYGNAFAFPMRKDGLDFGS